MAVGYAPVCLSRLDRSGLDQLMRNPVDGEVHVDRHHRNAISSPMSNPRSAWAAGGTVAIPSHATGWQVMQAVLAGPATHAPAPSRSTSDGRDSAGTQIDFHVPCLPSHQEALPNPPNQAMVISHSSHISPRASGTPLSIDHTNLFSPSLITPSIYRDNVNSARGRSHCPIPSHDGTHPSCI